MPAKSMLVSKPPARPSASGTRIAAIDIGSNAIRFLAVELTSAHHYLQLESDRIPVRLGRDADPGARLDPTVTKAAALGLERVARQMQALGIHRYRAVATAAVRDSRDGPKFVHAVEQASGLKIEPIPPAEEIRLVYEAARHRIERAGRKILIDVGGGSVD